MKRDRHSMAIQPGFNSSAGFSYLAQKVMLVLGLLAMLVALYAQQTSATLVGTINDASGGVITNANVKVVNLATGTTREVATDGAGTFSFPVLVAGDYEVTISLQGYKTKKLIG